MRFFLIAVEAVAIEATETANALHKLFLEDRLRVESLGKAVPSALKVYGFLKKRIVISPTLAAEQTGITWPTAISALERLEKLDIVREITGKRRDRLYAYSRQLEILDDGPHGPWPRQ